jgi:hypothetical protein
MAVDSTSVYWTGVGPTFGAGVVAKVPLAGGAMTMLATACNPGGIAVDGTSVYWTDWGLGAVMKAPK